MMDSDLPDAPADEPSLIVRSTALGATALNSAPDSVASVTNRLLLLPELKTELEKATRLDDAIVEVTARNARRLREADSELARLRQAVAQAAQALAAAERQREGLVRTAQENKDRMLASPDFRSAMQKDDLRLEIDQLERLLDVAKSPRAQSMPPPTNTPEPDLTCVVCFERPSAARQVFSCALCDNFLCGGCLAKMDECPICRTDFKAKAPIRLKCLERAFSE
jgi:hypothetical protein